MKKNLTELVFILDRSGSMQEMCIRDSGKTAALTANQMIVTGVFIIPVRLSLHTDFADLPLLIQTVEIVINRSQYHRRTCFFQFQKHLFRSQVRL